MQLWHLTVRNYDNRGQCFNPTSTRNSSGGLALKEVGFCPRHSSVLLQTTVQFHVEPILILLLYRSTLSILRPILCTFRQSVRDTLFTPFLFTNLVMTLARFSLLSVNREVLTTTREGAKQVQKKMNLARGQQNNQCINMSNNLQLKSKSKTCQTIIDVTPIWNKYLSTYISILWSRNNLPLLQA